MMFNRQMLIMIIMFLACYIFGNSSSNPKCLMCCFSFLKQPWRKTHHGHISAWQCQDSSGSNCKRMVGRENEE